jgi:hypothetical protein
MALSSFSFDISINKQILYQKPPPIASRLRKPKIADRTLSSQAMTLTSGDTRELIHAA